MHIGHMLNHEYPKAARITSMEFINGHDDALLMMGTDDGSCRIWRDFAPETTENINGSLVSAWKPLAEMSPSTRGSGLVLDWNQDALQMLATGEVRFVRVWDVNRELKVADVPTGSDNCVTSVHHSPRGSSISF